MQQRWMPSIWARAISNIDAADIALQQANGKLEASTDFSRVSEVDAVLICVPTPLNKYREPDISYVLKSGKAIAPHLKKGTLVILESTTYPGTTDTDLRAVLESGSGLKGWEDFHLAFSPEREDPGRKDHSVKTIPKVWADILRSVWSIASSFIQRLWTECTPLVPAESLRPPNSPRTSFVLLISHW